MQKEFRLAVDIEKKILTPSFEVNTLDLKTIKLKITITRGMTLVDLTGITVRMSIRKPDGNVLFQDCQVVDAKGGQVEIILENQAYVIPGSYSAEIMCFKGTDKVAVTGSFSYRSIKGIMDDKAIESKSEFTAITKQLDDVQATVTDLRENGTGIDAQARQEVEQVSEKLANIEEKTDVYAVDFNAVGDGITDDTVALQNAFNYAIRNKKALILNGTYFVKSGLSAVSEYIKIVGNNSKIIRDYSSIQTEGSILSVVGSYTEQPITANINIGDVIINTDSSGVRIGDIIYILTDEVYTQRGKTNTSYKKGFASRVVSIVSGTQIRVADRIPYSFDSTKNLKIRKTKSTVCDIENLTLEFTGSYGTKNGTGLNIGYMANADIDLKVLNASTASISTIYTYNGSVNIVDGVGGNSSIGLNYGVMSSGAYGTEFRIHCTAARHPLAFTGAPSYNALVKDSILTSVGLDDGVSFDAHCAGKVDVVNSKLPQGAKVSAGEYNFLNCYIGTNGSSPTACVLRRDSTFFKSLRIENCELSFHGNGAYIYNISPADSLLDYGDFIFKNNTVRTNNTGLNFNVITASGVLVTPNSVGNFIIKDNEFLLPAEAHLNLMHINDVNFSLKADSQGSLIVKDNTFNCSFVVTASKSNETSEYTADTFFKDYIIEDNISLNGVVTFTNFFKANHVRVFKNKIGVSQIRNAKNLFFENNSISSSVGSSTLLNFQDTENLFVKDNILISRNAISTTLFYVQGVTNMYFGSIWDTTEITNSILGTVTNLRYSEKIPHSTWNGSHIVLGNYHLWVDTSRKLRIKNGNPTSDTDGEVIGGQA